MDPTHRQRQATYRFWHPQLIWILVAQALQKTGESPQQILVRWAHQHRAESDGTESS